MLHAIFSVFYSWLAEIDILLIHFIATWYMVGLIWFVQLVHYPLFSKVDQQSHCAYHKAHVFWTTWAVGPAMLTELFFSIALYYHPRLPSLLTLSNLGLLGLIWLSTATLQVPCHERLSTGFEARIHRTLVFSNWIRTVGWSVKGGLALYLIRMQFMFSVG